MASERGHHRNPVRRYGYSSVCKHPNALHSAFAQLLQQLIPSPIRSPDCSIDTVGIRDLSDGAVTVDSSASLWCGCASFMIWVPGLSIRLLGMVPRSISRDRRKGLNGNDLVQGAGNLPAFPVGVPSGGTRISLSGSHLAALRPRDPRITFLVAWSQLQVGWQ